MFKALLSAVLHSNNAENCTQICTLNAGDNPAPMRQFTDSLVNCIDIFQTITQIDLLEVRAHSSSTEHKTSWIEIENARAFFNWKQAQNGSITEIFMT